MATGAALQAAVLRTSRSDDIPKIGLCAADSAAARRSNQMEMAKGLHYRHACL
jgi:hypothetical protein